MLVQNTLVQGQHEFFKKNRQETRLIVKYNVTDADNPTELYSYQKSGNSEQYWVIGNLLFDKVEIDGTEARIGDLDAAEGKYQLSSGEHTVAYTLKTQAIPYKAFSAIESLTSVIIPNNITTIGDYAFESCNGLTSVTIGNGVTTIGKNAFVNCDSITSIIIPDNVTSIDNNAFNACDALTSVTIGSGVTSIGSSAFNGNNNLSTITSRIMNAPSVSGGTFYNAKTGGTLYVPKGSSGYDTWMDTSGNLGGSNWSKVEQ